MFWWRDRSTPGLDWGFTDRQDGVSAGPWAGLNLARHVGDEAAAVTQNRTLLEGGLGAPVLYLNQCHTATVVTADGPWAADPPAADGVVTSRRGLAVAVLVADCTPILLADAEAGLVSAVHAGRPGLAAGIVERAVTLLREQGASSLTALVGPSVCPRCYEVPEEMRAEVSRDAPAAHAVSWTGTPALDVAAGAVEKLAALGVRVRWVPGCTREEPRLYSYRRDGTTGRFAGFALLTPHN